MHSRGTFCRKVVVCLDLEPTTKLVICFYKHTTDLSAGTALFSKNGPFFAGARYTRSKWGKACSVCTLLGFRMAYHPQQSTGGICVTILPPWTMCTGGGMVLKRSSSGLLRYAMLSFASVQLRMLRHGTHGHTVLVSSSEHMNARSIFEVII